MNTVNAKSTKPAANNAKRELATKIQSAFVTALDTRAQFATTMQELNLAKSFNDVNKSVKTDAFMLTVEKILSYKNADVMLFALASKYSATHKSHADFVAIYAIEKQVRIMFAIANNSTSKLDNYTRSISANLCKLDKLSNHNALRCICSKIVSTALDTVVRVDRLADCSVSTATTQLSSSRAALADLQIVTRVKFAKCDEMSKADNALARAYFKLFDVKATDVADDNENAAESV